MFSFLGFHSHIRIVIFDAEQVYFKPQVNNFKIKEVIMDHKIQTLKNLTLTLKPKPFSLNAKFTVNPKP